MGALVELGVLGHDLHNLLLYLFLVFVALHHLLNEAVLLARLVRDLDVQSLHHLLQLCDQCCLLVHSLLKLIALLLCLHLGLVGLLRLLLADLDFLVEQLVLVSSPLREKVSNGWKCVTSLRILIFFDSWSRRS